MQLFNIRGNWGVLHNTQTKERFEVQCRSYIIMNNFSHSQSKVSLAFHTFFFSLNEMHCAPLWFVYTTLFEPEWLFQSEWNWYHFQITNEKSAFYHSSPTMIIQVRSKLSFRGTQKQGEGSLKQGFVHPLNARVKRQQNDIIGLYLCQTRWEQQCKTITWRTNCYFNTWDT